MKKLAYITLVAAFIFGVQPQEAFSAENNALEMEVGGKGTVKMGFDQNSEILSFVLVSKLKERAQIVVYLNGLAVAKETVVLSGYGRQTGVDIDLSGMTSGLYRVKIESNSIQFKESFEKK